MVPAGGAAASGRPKPAAAGAAVPRQARFTVVGGRQLASPGTVVNYPSARSPRLPAVPASAYVVADADTGDVLAAKDPHGWFRPASTLKVLTAVTLMPVLKPDQVVVASRWAASMEPSKVGLVAGRGYRVSDLFRALLLISANDAAVSLVQATGSYAQGMAMMNAQAHHLQAYDTVAKTPNGLDARGQHVSAYDEALFARAALRIPEFMRVEALRRARFPVRAHHMVTLWNQNTMLETFRGDLGGKIGWTTPARATFIGWARRDGHTLLVTILHCKPLTEMTAAARLLNWGFAMDGTIKPVGRLVRPLPATTPHPAQQPRHAARAGTAAVPPIMPIAAASLSLAAVAAVAVAGLSRRRRRAGARSAR